MRLLILPIIGCCSFFDVQAMNARIVCLFEIDSENTFKNILL